MKIFSKDELKYFDGKEGRSAYVAYKGRVYDVTNSFLWKGGKHMALHVAGCDLTEELKKAPHGDEFIKRFPVVGVLECK